MSQIAAKKHISSDSEVRKNELHPSASGREDQYLHSLAYSSRYATSSIPKFGLPEKSVEPRVAYQLVHDELELDGRPAMNCASFVHTWMEPEADQLITESINKNLSDQDEYPATMRVQGCCISIIGNLWNAEKAVGTPTVGSSEAVMLGGLALKKRWQAARVKAGKDASRPNIILGNNAQVALEKFARYFDVESRLIPVTEESHHVLDIHKAVEACDENTIGIFIILGSTYTGHFEDVKGLSQLLDNLQERTGLDIPIHVDAASGGFVAPFAFPGLEWDFRLPRVVSINASGHKFGLCYPGIGWILWKSDQYLPKDLIFELHYLGGAEYSYGLNFSRPACFMIGQYYNFIRLGYEGYTRVIENCLSNARLLSNALELSGFFDCVSDMHREDGVFGYEKASAKQQAEDRKKKRDEVNYNPSLPVVSFKFTDDFKRRYPHVRQSAVSTLIRTKGWIVPNYSLPPNEEHIEILRIVVRESLSVDMVDRLIEDIMEAVDKLCKLENMVDEAVFAPLEEFSDYSYNQSKASDINKPKTYARTC